MVYSSAKTDKLYGLLPADIRQRDAAAGEPLRALLAIVEEQADLVEGDIRQMGENAFIETCEPWVIPYIGDLVGTVPIWDASRVTDGGTARELFPDLTGPDFTPTIGLGARADTAKTLSYRARKMTPAMLEELARDVTGWRAHVVEFFEICRWFQWVRNHARFQAISFPDLRSVDRMERVWHAWDETAHFPAFSPMGPFDGWHGVEKLGIFLWRLLALPFRRLDARALAGAGDFRFYFHPLGRSVPLFSPSKPELDDVGLALEDDVPTPFRRARFFEILLGAGGTLPFRIEVDGTEVPPARILCRNLDAWSQPANDDVAVDPATGRLTLGPLLVPATTVLVDWHQGFPGGLGGGPYPRRAWAVRNDLGLQVFEVEATGAGGAFTSITAALAAWAASGGEDATIRILDSRTYAETLAIDFDPAAGTFLSIEAAERERPHLSLGAALIITGTRPDASLTLSGLLVEGRVAIEGDLGRLRLLHTTLVPGASIVEPDPDEPLPIATPVEPSITAVDTLDGDPANTELRVEMAFAITGPLRLPRMSEALIALDSVVDGRGEAAIDGIGGAVGPSAHLERCTLLGSTSLRMVRLATEVIFDGLVLTERRQEGCVRFSYVPPGSETPRRYRCQPELAERIALDEAGPLTAVEATALRTRIRTRVRPDYTSENYPDPAYCQLTRRAAVEISAGAEDGSEIGAWSHLKQPQREANLRLRLEEYLPFGLEAGLIYES